MSKKFSPRQQAKARNLIVKDMILRGSPTPIADKRTKRASERAAISQEFDDSNDNYDDGYYPRSRGNDYNEG